MGHEPLSSLLALHDSAALLRALPPGLQSLGAVECSWLDPLAFFRALCDEGRGPPRWAAGLRDLALFTNSPGACRAAARVPASATVPRHGRDTAATRPLGAGRADVDAFAAGVVSAAGFADDCALHMAAAYTAALFPALERLLIEWYDNDDLPAGGVARALAPLRGCSSLRELHLCRSDADCGSIDADAQSFARAFVAGGEGAAPCPALRVCVHDAPGRGFDGGETAWAIECGFLPWCVA